MEALVLVVDVGASTGAPAADGGASFLETALQCCDRILQRKLFEDKNKDHAALVLLGTAESDNPLADDDGDQYQHVSVARRLAPVDWALIRQVRDEVRAETAEGDWLDALVVALNHLQEAGRTHKYASRRIVLLTEFAGPLCTDQLGAIEAGLQRMGVELTAIGAPLAEYGDEKNGVEAPPPAGPAAGDAAAGPSGMTRHDGKPKTMLQLEGEEAAQRLLRVVGGEHFTFEQALPQLVAYQQRRARAAPWHAPLQLGESLSIPITGYSHVRKAVPPSWKKMSVAGAQPAPVKRRIVYERQDESRTVVPPEETVMAYRYGTTLVPFSRVDQGELQYRSGAPRSLQILGFTAAANVGPQLYQDTQTVQIVARDGAPGAAEALSALIHALQETDMVAVARRTYNANNAPRLGALLPRITHTLECLVWVQLPFAEDVRNPLFRPLPETHSQAALDAVDQLIDAMDLTSPAGQAAGERWAPGELVSPQFQRLYQVLAARALHPGAPLPPVDADLLRQLSPDPALAADGPLRALAAACPLTEVTLPHQKRETGRDVFAPAAAAAADGAAPPASVADITGAAVTEIGTVTPAEDFDALLGREDVQFEPLCAQMQRVITQLIREAATRPALVDKTLAALRRLRAACAGVSPAVYNRWVRQARPQLTERPALWQRVVAERLGPISAAESTHPAAEDAELEEFYREEPEAAPAAPAQQEQAEDLLDDL